MWIEDGSYPRADLLIETDILIFKREMCYEQNYLICNYVPGLLNCVVNRKIKVLKMHDMESANMFIIQIFSAFWYFPSYLKKW